MKHTVCTTSRHLTHSHQFSYWCARIRSNCLSHFSLFWSSYIVLTAFLFHLSNGRLLVLSLCCATFVHHRLLDEIIHAQFWINLNESNVRQYNSLLLQINPLCLARVCSFACWWHCYCLHQNSLYIFMKMLCCSSHNSHFSVLFTTLLLGHSCSFASFRDVFSISVALSLGAVLRLSNITPGGSLKMFNFSDFLLQF